MYGIYHIPTINHNLGESFLNTSISIKSLVTAILANYRGYDTLWETMVILTAAYSVKILSGAKPPSINDQPLKAQYKIARRYFGFISAGALAYTLYIQFVGEIFTGGGFQAGALLASIIIAHNMLFYSRVRYDLSLACIGMMLYISASVASIFFGYNFLNYHIFASDHHLAEEIGIFIVEAGVFITVAFSLSSIANQF
jgi:multicomponent Na+:H+ antiporter subunit B